MKRISTVIFLLLIGLSNVTHGQLHDFNNTDFNRADSVAALYPKHALKDLKSLAGKLTHSLPTEEEKFRAIYKWVCSNIEYDYTLFKKNQYKRKNTQDPEELKNWNKKIRAQVFRNLRNKQKTVCTGYAYLVKELAMHAGLNCVIVDGYGRTVQSNVRGVGQANHSWNAVQLNNKWYLCDPTWSGGAYDTQLEKYVKKFDDAYFLAEPSLFVRNHYPLDTTWMLVKKKPTLYEFLNGPLIYVNAYHYQFNPVFPHAFDVTVAKGEKVSFKFSNNDKRAIEKTNLVVNRSGTVNTLPMAVQMDATGQYCMDYIFTTKGTHIVHILLNDSYVVTYSVTVI